VRLTQSDVDLDLFFKELIKLCLYACGKRTFNIVISQIQF